jgi:peptide/nickel transport system permease protein
VTQYVIRRLLLAVPTLLGVSLLVFLIVRALPGDVVEAIIGQYTPISETDRERVRRELGLDEPVYTAYLNFVGGAVQGDFGTSLQSGQPVSDEIQDRLPVTLELGLMALLFGLIIGLPIGVFAAIRQDSWADYFARSTAIGFLAIPNFWLATMVIVYPSVWWKWAPPIKFEYIWDDPKENLYMISLPALILGVGLAGSIMRHTRAQMLEVRRQDYIRTAWAKGMKERSVVLRHALKNAFIPVVTLIGLQIPVVLGGTVVLETIFNVPGMGRYLVQSILIRNYPVVQAVNLLIACSVVFSNLLVDVAYGYLDPRIRFR